MELDELFRLRQSCRNYDASKKVSTYDLEKILDAARIAPSARNAQPWHFTVVIDEEILPKIRKSCQKLGFNKFTDNVNAFIIVQEDKDLASKIIRRDFAPIDIGLSTSQMILKAAEIGLSTCIIGAFDEEKVREACHIKSKQPIKILVAVGYAASEDVIRDKKRKELKDIATFL